MGDPEGGAPVRLERVGDGAARWIRDPRVDARALLAALRAHPGIADAVVTEQHALVTFDPSSPPPLDALLELASSARSTEAPPDAREHVIRARYDGPDLDGVAARAGLTRDEVVRAHVAGAYEVRVVGFLPGFAYLGPLAPSLRLPRRPAPRPRVPAGAIGIAAGYTAVYPFASPGGWNLIAHAVDFAPFDRQHGARLALGDRVRFEVAP